MDRDCAPVVVRVPAHFARPLRIAGIVPLMSRYLAAAIVLLLCAVPLQAEADDAAASVSPVDAIFQGGETLEFSLSWLGISGGKATMTIGPAEGQPGRYRIESLAESSPSFARIYKVRDWIESVVERDSFTTVHFRKVLQEKKRRKDVTTEFDYDRGFATRRDKQIPISKPLLDPLSTVYFARKLELVPGRRYRATLIADSKVVQPEIVVVKRERITTEAGSFKTVMVEPKLRGGSLFREGDNRLFIWYTDDARKVPVKIRSELSFGSITASLRAIRPGAPSPSPPNRD